MAHFILSFRFLDDGFHGRGNQDSAEWPPSPLRGFQALVSAAGAIATGTQIPPDARKALEWLEGLEPPVIYAPISRVGTSYNVSIPYNGMDVVAAAWSRGNLSNTGDASPATHRLMKDFRTTWMAGETTVHYVWSVAGSENPSFHVSVLRLLASEVLRLGWGIDVAIGSAEWCDELPTRVLSGQRWTPHQTHGSSSRVPKSGTLRELEQRHSEFLSRLSSGTLEPPSPLDTFSTREYRLATARPQPEWAMFALLNSSGTRRAAFDAARKGLTVAGQLRDATRRAALSAGWTNDRVDSYVLGHRIPSGSSSHVPVGARRFAYWPLPTIRGGSPIAGGIQRVAVTSFDSSAGDEIAWARTALGGQSLVDEDSKITVALMSLAPPDGVTRRYSDASASWASVTPVVLPGYDDPKHYRRRLARKPSTKEQKEMLRRLDERVDGLLRKSLVHAGIAEELVRAVLLEWSSVGFVPGVARADAYGVPGHLRRFPRLHVRLTWRKAGSHAIPVPGPFCIGAGRFYGLGLLVGLD